jgi:hypothetical protein
MQTPGIPHFEKKSALYSLFIYRNEMAELLPLIVKKIKKIKKVNKVLLT